MNAANSANPVKAIGRCQICGNMCQTSPVKFHHNIGMVVLPQTRSIEENMCKTCRSSKHWQFMAKNLLRGPWDLVSVIVTPIYMVTNTVSYVSSARKLRDAVE